MIFTARQLEDLLKANGRIVLPYGARLTPLAQDWARSRKLAVGYGPDELVRQAARLPQPVGAQAPQPQAPGHYLWWCDGPCGSAKAAISALAREASLAPIEARTLAEAIRQAARAVKSQTAAGAALLVRSAGAGAVLANRAPSLRAIVGTTLESLEAGLGEVAANVLLLEYERRSFNELKNLLSRFVRARRSLGEPAQALIREIAACE